MIRRKREEYFAEPPAGAIALEALPSEHFKVGHIYSVYIEETSADSR